MKKFILRVEQAGGEYHGYTTITGKQLTRRGNRKVEVDGVVINFDENIVSIDTKLCCFRCNGKGGYEQLTGFSEDDTAWDLCPECNGSGIES
jgi:DnaJ-class molecular chaperone